MRLLPSLLSADPRTQRQPRCGWCLLKRLICSLGPRLVLICMEAVELIHFNGCTEYTRVCVYAHRYMYLLYYIKYLTLLIIQGSPEKQNQ